MQGSVISSLFTLDCCYSHLNNLGRNSVVEHEWGPGPIFCNSVKAHLAGKGCACTASPYMGASLAAAIRNGFIRIWSGLIFPRDCIRIHSSCTGAEWNHDAHGRALYGLSYPMVPGLVYVAGPLAMWMGEDPVSTHGFLDLS